MDKLAQINIGKNFLGNSSKLLDEKNIGTTYVSNIVTASLTIAGVILLFFLISGGIAMISGAGNNDPQKVAQGQKAATSALIGFIVVIAAYWIVKLIAQLTGLPLI